MGVTFIEIKDKFPEKLQVSAVTTNDPSLGKFFLNTKFLGKELALSIFTSLEPNNFFQSELDET